MEAIKHVDPEWFKTAEGEQCIQQLYNPVNGNRKQFGLLERPNITLSATELFYKICLAGKAGSGKSKVVSFLSGEHNPSPMYAETVGIHVKDVYWPVQMKGKMSLFRLQFWEAGEMCSKKYSYIQSGCFEKADAIAAVINKGDKSSLDFLESKYDSLLLTCQSLFAFVLDTDSESSEVHDQDLLELARSKRLPLFHLPNQAMSPKFLAPLLNSLCDFLYSSAMKSCQGE